MILLVLLLIFCGLALFAFVAFRVFPRVATKLGIPEGFLAVLCLCFLFVGFAAYANSVVECPFCHAGRVDNEGRCRLGDGCSNYYSQPQWNQMSAKEQNQWTGNPGHHKAKSCPWCGRSGKMSRIAVWLD
jgi:hypothetical protein